MNRMARCGLVVAAILLLGSHAKVAPPLDQEYLFNVIKNPAYRAAWDALFKGEREMPSWLVGWADQSTGPTSPCGKAVVNDVEYAVHTVCKAHECGDNQFVVFFAPEGRQAWGVLITESERFFGNPDQLMQYALLDARTCE